MRNGAGRMRNGAGRMRPAELRTTLFGGRRGKARWGVPGHSTSEGEEERATSARGMFSVG